MISVTLISIGYQMMMINVSGAATISSFNRINFSNPADRKST